MERLAPSQHPAAHALYSDHCSYFPLIAAVLAGDQDGVILADCVKNPTQVYVEHAFGFAQIFGMPVPAFERALKHYLFVDKAFSCSKVRLYTPNCPDFMQSSEYDSLRSWRQHFELDAAHTVTTTGLPQETLLKSLTIEYADAAHVSSIEDNFGVVSRFWRTPKDFVRYSNAVLALVNTKAAALCYAAAVGGGRAEIDVLTLPAYRQLGLAKAVVNSFNQRCRAQNLLPLWDCFTNNTASMALCQSVGFKPLGDPYPFLTINR